MAAIFVEVDGKQSGQLWCLCVCRSSVHTVSRLTSAAVVRVSRSDLLQQTLHGLDVAPPPRLPPVALPPV